MKTPSHLDFKVVRVYFLYLLFFILFEFDIFWGTGHFMHLILWLLPHHVKQLNDNNGLSTYVFFTVHF